MCWKKQLLHEVSKDELMKFRLSGKAGCLIKCNDKLYVTRLKRKSALPTYSFAPLYNEPTLCGSCDKVCGVCPKTSALTLPCRLALGNSFPEAVKNYGRIEKYDFIKEAIEFFDKENSNCIVFECENYVKRNPNDYEEQYFAETI